MQIEGIIIQITSIGEHHKQLLLLSPEEGITTLRLYGAASRKNPMRATCQIFARGIAKISARNSRFQLEDWELLGLFNLESRSLEHFYHASLWSEILYRSRSVAESTAKIYPIFKQILLSPRSPYLLSLIFFSHFLYSEGWGVDLEHCSNCSSKLSELKAQFINFKTELLCQRCRRGPGLIIAPEDYKLLLLISTLDTKREVPDLANSPAALNKIANIYLHNIENIFGHSFRSVKSTKIFNQRSKS